MNFFDLHCDTATVCIDRGIDLSGDMMISLTKREELNSWAEVFAIWLPCTLSDEQARTEYLRYLKGFNALLEKHRAQVALCTSDAAISETLAQGKCAALLAIENGSALGGKLENIERVAADGVRMITITWNGENALGYGSDVGGRLKPFGREAVSEMVRCGILPDISHLSDEGVEDLLSLTDTPVIATHSDMQAVCGHCRNLNDTFFKEIARRGGLVGVNLYTSFLSAGDTAEWDDLFRHIDRMLELGGENTAAFGSDFDGAKMPAFCRDLADIPEVYSRCVQRYGKAQSDKIFFENARAFFARRFSKTAG